MLKKEICVNALENKMLDLILDLKENYQVCGLKAEFEDEGAAMDEVMRLKQIGLYAGIDLTVKIGGCGAVKDLYDAKALGAGSIVAPMIESPYAVKKFINTSKAVFSKEEMENIKFYINIESQYGFQYIDEIFNSEYSKFITGIVLGRTDLTGSLGMDKDDINNNIIFDYAQSLSLKTKKYDKELIIGGGITDKSIDFIKRLSLNSTDKFETRKIVFGIDSINFANISGGIAKAIEFELLWLKNKQNYYNIAKENDIMRLKSLENKYKLMVEKCYA